MRVIIGGIHHVTNTFSSELASFESYQGEALLEALQGSHTAVGGFLAGANMYGFELIPTLFAQAPTSSGPAPRPVFDQLVDSLLEGIQRANPIDAVLLSLHGGTAVGNLDNSDGLHDPEGHLLQQVRQAVGEKIPIVAQLDIHANVSPQMAEMADVLIGGESFPAVDTAARGRECVEVLLGIRDEDSQPTMALEQMPLVWGVNQITAVSPMEDAIAYLHELENRPGVVKASLALGNPLADVSKMGASAYVVTENNVALAQQYAKELAIYCHVRRKDWHDDAQASAETRAILEKQGFPLDVRTMAYKRLGRKLYPIHEI